VRNKNVTFTENYKKKIRLVSQKKLSTIEEVESLIGSIGIVVNLFEAGGILLAIFPPTSALGLTTVLFIEKVKGGLLVSKIIVKGIQKDTIGMIDEVIGKYFSRLKGIVFFPKKLSEVKWKEKVLRAADVFSPAPSIELFREFIFVQPRSYHGK
jgi:hypothetical protein